MREVDTGGVAASGGGREPPEAVRGEDGAPPAQSCRHPDFRVPGSGTQGLGCYCFNSRLTANSLWFRFLLICPELHLNKEEIKEVR